MSDLDQMIDKLRQLAARPEAADRDWYRVEAKTVAGRTTAKVWLYDDIGWLGTSAKSFAAELKALDVDEIDLHLNSPGGGAWDGIAIYNTLRDHQARVTVIVDGMAASAASVIAMAGDKVRMNRGAQMMIHDARGVAAGPPAVMAIAADMLDKLSDEMASIYASKAGGTVEEWRAAMGAETWYSPQEAVDAGLADEMTASEPVDATAKWDMAAYAFAYAGRAAAPAPTITRRPEPATASVSAAQAARQIHAASTRNNQEGAGRMDPAKIREALGLPPDASDGEVTAAFAKAGLANQPDPSPTPNPEPGPTNPPAPAPAGVMHVSASAWEEREKQIARLSAYVEESKRGERDQVLAKAMSEGKFTPAQLKDFERMWDANPDTARAVVDGLTPNTALAIAALGTDGDVDQKLFDAEFAGMFPAGFFPKGV